MIVASNVIQTTRDPGSIETVRVQRYGELADHDGDHVSELAVEVPACVVLLACR